MKFKGLYIPKKILIIGAIIGIAFAALLISIANTPQLPTLPKPPDYVEPDAPIALKNGDAIYDFFQSDIQFDALRSDLTVFAANVLKNTSSQLMFEVSATEKQSETVMRITGTFNVKKTVYLVTVEKLANERIKVAIADKDNPANTTTNIPSNTKANLFAATLPIENTNYHISYIAATESFVVRYYNPSQSVVQEVETLLTNNGLSLDSVEFIYPRTEPRLED